MINIYDKNETEFSTNGIVVIQNSKSCFITEELNGQYELELEYPIDNRGKWQYLTEGNIARADEQLFRIYRKIKTLAGIKINARHVFYDLIDNLINEVDIRALSGAHALERVMSNTAYAHNFTYMSDITDVNNLYLDDETGDIINKNPVEAIFFLMSLYGGELVRDNFNIKWLQQRWQDRGVLVSYGKNIKGIEEDINLDSVITRIKPIGQDGLTLDEIYVDSPYINNYPYPKIKVIEFGECNDYESLRAAAQKYFEDNKCDIPPTNYKIDFVELSKTEEYKHYKVLERIYIGDTVTVKHTKLGINLKCKVIKIKKDVLNNRIVEVELGNFKKNIVDTMNNIRAVTDVFGKAIEGDKLSKSFLQSWVDNATNLILKGNDGHVIQDENGISIMDTTDKMTCEKVWRWNINGLGYSSTGYNGPFATAITSDGKIVADFMTAGELNGAILKAGSVLTNALEVNAQQVINTTVPSLENDNTTNKNAITTLQTTVEAIPGQIDSKVSAATDPINSNVSGLDTRLTEAEEKITSEAITSTVRSSTEYNTDIQDAKDYADNASDTAETNAKDYADSVAQAEANLAETTAKAYADGIVTAEEQARINDAQTKLNEAKTYADNMSDSAETNAKNYTDTQLNDFVSSIYNVDISDLQNQIDGNITSWFYDGVPTLSNNPAVTWNTDDLKNNHLGDLYYDNLTGYAYRFRLNNSVYEWLKITDTDITKALADAAKAQDTADNKRRVFVTEPIPPYDLGDLWSQGTNGDLMKCIVAKISGQTYSSNDWEKASKYTDDTVANEAKNTADDLKNNTIPVLTERVSSAEQKITDEAIINTVTKSEKYLEYSLVPNKATLTVSRNALIINPLSAYNYVGGNIINANELIVVNNVEQDLVYIADLQIANEEIITFNKPSERIEEAESKIEQHADSISLVVKENGTINGDSIASAINIGSTKIEMSALNIDFTGYVTFNALGEEGQTVIHGGNIIPQSISFNSLSDKPFIPSQYTDSEALQAWVSSGYATYIDSTGAYFGSVKVNQLLIGGENGSISFNDLSDKPTIPSQYTDALALQAWVNSGYKTYINSSGVYTGNLTALQITTPLETADIVKVYRYIQFTKNPADLNGIQIDSSTGIMKIYADQGLDIVQTFNPQQKLKVNGQAVATEAWVNDNVIGGAVYAKFK